jgi:DNA-3-methyladenine glycosylase II
LPKAILNEQLNLESLEFKNPELVRAELIKIKGIGNWTIDSLFNVLSSIPDVIPLGDIAIVNTMKELYDIQSVEEMEEISHIGNLIVL